MSTTVHAVTTPLNTCRASRACRDARLAVLSDKRDTAGHDFFLCQNAWA